MRLLLLLAGCLLVGCFQPVNADARQVSSCKGSCPFGECNDHCAGLADGGCATPEECLRAYNCSKAGSQPCSSYQGDFTLGTASAACAQANGSYCLTTLGADGSKRTWAVVCADGGQTSTDCAYDPCGDAGTYPAECRIACASKLYCVR